MSFTFDANVLLYASDDSSPRRTQARAFLERVAGGDELAYLFWPTALAYVRIATHPSVFARPLSLETALANLDALLGLDNVQTTGERGRFWRAYRQLAVEADVRGNLVPDAHLVALMVENGVRVLWSHDRDFRRFTGIDVRDPFD